MAIAFKAFVFNLVSEFLAHTLVVFGAAELAGAIAARELKTFFDSFNNLFVFVQAYFHKLHILHGKRNSFFVLIDRKHFDFYNVSDL